MNSDQSSDRKAAIRRRYFSSLGVQLAIAVLFISILWFMSNQEKPNVRIEHKVVPSENSAVTYEPTIGDLLANKEKLQLNRTQVQDLTKLQERQNQDLIPVEKQLKDAIADFESFMAARGKKRTNMGEILSHSGPATTLGKRKRLLIQTYSQEAIKLLNNNQKILALQLKPKPHKSSQIEEGDNKKTDATH